MRRGTFAKTLEPNLAVADCCGAVVGLERPGRFRHPVYCDGECPVSSDALRNLEEA